MLLICYIGFCRYLFCVMVPEIFLPYLFMCYYVRDFKTVFFHYGQTIVNCTLNLIRGQRMLDSIALKFDPDGEPVAIVTSV